MRHASGLSFAADHPTAAGHFPSNPIIPGALILDEVVAAIAAETGSVVTGIAQAKFLRPVRPGQHLALRWQSSVPGSARFECVLDGGEIAVTGVLEIGPMPP